LLQIISHLHRRFTSFTPSLLPLLTSLLAPPSKQSLASLTQEQRDKEDSARISRQRPVLRVCTELALVGILGPEWVVKVIKDLLSNDPSLSSLPLLSLFLRSYSYPYLSILPPSTKSQIPQSTEPGTLSSSTSNTTSSSTEPTEPNGTTNMNAFPSLPSSDTPLLVPAEIQTKFRKLLLTYYDSVCKKLLIEHTKLQEQDRKNHEAYIRSGEIFQDREAQYEKMARGYERVLQGAAT
jgi:regulator of nonsense transcripts 2